MKGYQAYTRARSSYRFDVAVSDPNFLVNTFLKIPVLICRLDSPFEFLPQRLGEEALDGDVVFLREDDGEAGIDVILRRERKKARLVFRFD
jgi:hypothetical protein